MLNVGDLKITPQILAAVLAAAIFSAAFARERIRPQYDFRDSSLSLVFSFDIPNLPEEEILDILFRYERVKQYSAKTNLKITLLEENERENRILYEYNYLVARLGVEMQREKIPEERKVVFNMVRYERTSKIIPIITAAGGSYQIMDDATILYKQQTAMNRKITPIYEMIIKRDVRGYLKAIMDYMFEAQNQ